MTNSALDKEDFCRLVEVHQSALYRTARSILSNQQDVEDAVQEAVCAAYSHLDRLREPEKFKAWLLKILVNECYDLCRRQRRTVDFDQMAESLTTPEPGSRGASDAVGCGPSAAGAHAGGRHAVLL